MTELEFCVGNTSETIGNNLEEEKEKLAKFACLALLDNTLHESGIERTTGCWDPKVFSTHGPVLAKADCKVMEKLT